MQKHPVVVVFPVPSSPYWLLPHAQTAPVEERATLCSSPLRGLPCRSSRLPEWGWCCSPHPRSIAAAPSSCRHRVHHICSSPRIHRASRSERQSIDSTAGHCAQPRVVPTVVGVLVLVIAVTELPRRCSSPTVIAADAMAAATGARKRAEARLSRRRPVRRRRASRVLLLRKHKRIPRRLSRREAILEYFYRLRLTQCVISCKLPRLWSTPGRAFLRAPAKRIKQYAWARVLNH